MTNSLQNAETFSVCPHCESPVKAEDPEVAPLIQSCGRDKQILTASFSYEALVLATRHQQYLDLTPDEVGSMTGHPIAVIDCFGLLSDAYIRRYFELGCEVKGLGRGHVKRLKDSVHNINNEEDISK
ncbi:MAG: hypothetical protein K9J79_08340 [Desulfobacteraceae bacterium]|nr:hypothetical protein [Desulfobacteraceae bacterium]